ncbi:MAG: FAD-dependent oxidoreductase [Treponema sp.]|nr:FAD-dependent oxidoreductase [Treponema sp.]
MQTSITITLLPEEEGKESLINSKIAAQLKRTAGKDFAKFGGKFEAVFVKKSIDARHGQLKLHLRYNVFLGEKAKGLEDKDALPDWKKADGKKSVIIVGSGPAGLFGALKLLEKGIKPVILERGEKTSERKKDIAKISTKDSVNPDSNYCFGEGGAGTFSDGKLYTRSNKRGNIGRTLLIFNHFGADKKILTDAHPHIGTDRLPTVINNMRDKIIELGGEFYFNTRVTDLITEENNGGLFVKGVTAENTKTGEKADFYADAVVLATGHSASDIYMMLAKKAPSALEAKTFAVGVRVEHPRILIDAIQYHGKRPDNLGAAEYRVTTQVDERGVYSFCMCPGGFVVPSASAPDEIVVNGMSSAARNSKWSNAAIVTEIRPEDIPQKFVEAAKKAGAPQLAGLFFRAELEKLAFKNGKGQAAPAQRLSDFLKNQTSEDLPPSSYTAGLVSSNLNSWLPPFISRRLAQGFRQIDKNMKGFICPDALMIAVETRTSTPVRILRDKESLECPALKGLYPCGEGSGYSGGIVSSAMDGENICERIINAL